MTGAATCILSLSLSLGTLVLRRLSFHDELSIIIMSLISIIGINIICFSSSNHTRFPQSSSLMERSRCLCRVLPAILSDERVNAFASSVVNLVSGLHLYLSTVPCITVSKMYSSRDFHGVMYRNTNLSFDCLCMAERWGCPVFS